jgi:hypothetical protein
LHDAMLTMLTFDREVMLSSLSSTTEVVWTVTEL